MNNLTPVTVNRRSSQEERQFALTQIYRQVLERQPYESERQMMAQLEKDFLKDKIGVRRFLKEFGCSDIYLDAFYYPSSNVKFLDICFKHFMGRAVLNHEEMRFYSDVLAKKGVHSLITTILDSEEYRKAFGCFTVPYPREKACYESPNAFVQSRLLNDEHVGQRGWAVPTMYWRQLGLNCSGGVCRHPEVDEMERAASSNQLLSLSTEALLELLRGSSSIKAREVIASLSPTQRAELRQALR
ncbi:phycobilisome linker polypeptide [Leptolyngbya sp. 'hensonii']|uniref:phycobilisome rod-core linker polypeptide n=1 Tax=Leptolyngbya sp. 'hensonii' TaxID=1922337 RepID=UPI0009501F3B|nr:phycobilisome rod-core linker polypeptide [Leptolyngbya sp. 'hensonii']OLP19326.1 phycobilisome linker polypeptide [Leptolyngbya sp. 'hensonii']